LYDPGYTWYGATLAGFGIVYNKVVLQLHQTARHCHMGRLGVASGNLVGWVHPTRARAAAYIWPTRSFSRRTVGRRLADYHRIGANVRNFTDAAPQVPKDVSIGEVAYGLAIDFYAWAQVNEAGADKIGFVMPENLTVINPDCIGILRGAPNRAVAEAFIRFVMSAAGQKLWLWAKGIPDGPQRFSTQPFQCSPVII